MAGIEQPFYEQAFVKVFDEPSDRSLATSLRGSRCGHRLEPRQGQAKPGASAPLTPRGADMLPQGGERGLLRRHAAGAHCGRFRSLLTTALTRSTRLV